MKLRRILPTGIIILSFLIPVHQNACGQDYGTGAITSLSGPRLGLTIVGGKMAEKLKEDYDATPVITQFGWQFEWRFFAVEDGATGVVEIIPLLGGMEQNLFLPSLSGLIGLRSPEGLELGLGPNVSVSGASIVFAGGFTKRAGQLNIPINFAVVPSPNGTRFSFLVGFNMAR